MNLAADKDDAQAEESASAPAPVPDSPAAKLATETSSPPWPSPIKAPQLLAILLCSLIGTAIIVVGLLLAEMLVPAHVASDLTNEAESLRRQNDALRRAGEQSAATIKAYERKLSEPPVQLQSQIAQMQATIDALEQEIDAVKAAEWPPLASTAQDALYDVLKGLPAREVWVGYADSGGRALARTFSDVFKRLNWPQKYDILAVADPQQGLWITPISDFSDEVRNRVQQATGLEFQSFPHREQLPDAKQIGIIIGYRTANDADVP